MEKDKLQTNQSAKQSNFESWGINIEVNNFFFLPIALFDFLKLFFETRKVALTVIAEYAKAFC